MTGRFRLWILGLAAGFCVAGAGHAQVSSDYPKFIEQAFGQILIPEKPARIISLQPWDVTDSLIALGHPPLASATNGLADPRAEDAWPPVIRPLALELGIGSIGTPTEPSLEAIALLEPDLIIAHAWQADALYDRLSLIAPTLVVPYERDFRPTLLRIARAIDAMPEAEAVLQQLQQLQGDIRQAHGGTEIAIIRPRQFSTWLYGPGSNAGKLLTEAGLEVVVPAGDLSVSADTPGAINDVSLERVPGIEASFLFFIMYNLDEPLTRYLRHPVWQRNDAVAEGRAAGVQGIAWTNHGPLGALEMLREAKQALDSRPDR